MAVGVEAGCAAVALDATPVLELGPAHPMAPAVKAPAMTRIVALEFMMYLSAPTNRGVAMDDKVGSLDGRYGAAVDDVVGPVDRRGGVGGEERHELGDLRGASGASDRDPADHVGDRLAGGG